MARRFFDLEATCNDDSWPTPRTTSLSATDEDAGPASGASRVSGLTVDNLTEAETTAMGILTSSLPLATTTLPSRFRIHARRLALTFPQNDTTKDVAMARILEKWSGDIKWCVVTQESHQDGCPHLHIAISFSKKKDFKRPDFADFIAGAHGNYQAMKNELDWLKYITKSDAHPVLHKIDVEVLRELYMEFSIEIMTE